MLLADPDAVYDPGYCNDRLLLGLKDDERAELYLIRQRMLLPSWPRPSAVSSRSRCRSATSAALAEDERAALDKLWRQRLERARYAADRARRQYQLAEPENRLVTRQLEAGWGEHARPRRRGWKRTASGSPDSSRSVLTEGEREAIRSLAADLPRVWHASTTTQADRKELLRILIEDITVNVAGDSELAGVTITWAGGHQTSGQAVVPSPARTSSRTSPRSWNASPGSPEPGTTAARSRTS